MYSNVQPFINSDLTNCFQSQYTEIESLLFNLLDSPVKYTKHIGGTHHFKYSTEPILDILVGVENLHDITSLDEKRLNYVGFYRLHHKYNKKVMMAKFNNFHELKQQVRLHIIQMNTQTFESYLALDYLLSTNDEIALQFNTKSIKYCNIALQLDNMRCKSKNTLKNYVKILITTIVPYFIIILILILSFQFSQMNFKIGIILYDIKDTRKDVLRSDK